MTRYAAFLRGVNVGGVSLRMAEVAAVFTDAGFDNVKTILASGNALLDSPSSTGAVRKKSAAALREAFVSDADVQDELATLATGESAARGDGVLYW